MFNHKELPLQWLYLDLNSYFATIEQQVDINLREKPVAVVAVDTDSTCAIAASYHAKLKGIKTGTPIYEAKKLCPELICIIAKHDLYVKYHHKILKEVERYLYIDHVLSIDECACKLTGRFCIEDEALAIAKNIKQGIKDNVGDYITCSIGIAPNRFLAKVATEIQKPNGLVVVKGEDIPEKLYRLKLRDMPGIGAKVAARLNRARVNSMENLYSQSHRDLRRIWGSITGERFWYALRGIELPDIRTTNHSIGNSQVLAPELRDVSNARNVADRLLLKAASRLRRKGFYASMLSLSLYLESRTTVRNRIKFSHSCDSFVLKEKLIELWDDLVNRHDVLRVKKIAVTLSGLVDKSKVQPDLFAQETTEIKSDKTTILSKTIDLINKRYGKDTITIGVLPSKSKDIATTKVAFSRIPDIEEFFE
jgi:DNA polymerase-4